MDQKKEKQIPFLVWLIVDGWGIAPNNIGNVFSLVKNENFKELTLKYPAASLAISSTPKKNISRSDNYFTLGTGSFLQKKNSCLIEDLEKKGIKTLTICSEERYAEMNFFFTGRKKITNSAQLTIKIDKHGKTTKFLASNIVKAIKKGEHGLIVASFSDLEIAATNNELNEAAGAAIEIDEVLKEICKVSLSRRGVVVITGSIGKAEAMINVQTEIPNKKNTANPVPFILVGREYEGQTMNFPEAPQGDLSLVSTTGDISMVAPLILDMLV